MITVKDERAIAPQVANLRRHPIYRFMVPMLIQELEAASSYEQLPAIAKGLLDVGGDTTLFADGIAAAARWPAGSFYQGERVGGQFMPASVAGVTEGDEETLEEVRERLKRTSLGPRPKTMTDLAKHSDFEKIIELQTRIDELTEEYFKAKEDNDYLDNRATLELDAEIKAAQLELWELQIPFEQWLEEDLFERRLAEVKSAEGPDREWREGVIQAEKKYGKLLDEMRDKPTPEAYEALINKIRKVSPKKISNKAKKIKGGEKSFLEGLAQPFGIGKMTHDLLEETFADKPYKLSDVISDGRDALSLSNIQPKLGYFLISNPNGSAELRREDILAAVRTNANPLYQELYEQGIKEVTASDLYAYVAIDPESVHVLEAKRPVTPKGVVWHETGHAIEQAAEIAQASDAFLRTKEAEQDETSVKGQTFNTSYPFQRYYAPNGDLIGTEVFSTGLESLATPRLLTDELKQDREHILYTLFVLDKQ